MLCTTLTHIAYGRISFPVLVRPIASFISPTLRRLEPRAALTITTLFHDITNITGPFSPPNATSRNPVVPHELERIHGEDQEECEVAAEAGRGRYGARSSPSYRRRNSPLLSPASHTFTNTIAPPPPNQNNNPRFSSFRILEFGSLLQLSFVT
jgi:hypothetical protein